MAYVLLLTGTCGSGKTTIAGLVGARPGWTRFAEDDVWPRLFARARGPFGSDEHRRKRSAVHAVVFSGVAGAVRRGYSAVIDATVHESPPEAFLEYRAFSETLGVSWLVRVLHPRLEIAIARDAARAGWRAGPLRVAALRAKFTQATFPGEWFVDTSDQLPAETAAHLVSGLV